jgi:hypothetical protein
MNLFIDTAGLDRVAAHRDTRPELADSPRAPMDARSAAPTN